ncbi:recombinase family protein [Halorubrum sp. SD626R]|uniref:recombinase family protein n=1 Tax=Halorubrum sp. SD626R TaxID=1419722 RepID=UPI00130532C1|nr:recombinase family protein [Halorubrum sp. SD626R]
MTFAQNSKTACKTLLPTASDEFTSTDADHDQKEKKSQYESNFLEQLVGGVRSNLLAATELLLQLNAASDVKDENDKEDENGKSNDSDEFTLDDFAHSNGSGDSEGSDNSECKDEDMPDGEDDRDTGVIYARESDLSSVKDGRNMDGQIGDLQDLAEREGIELVSDPITDEGQTGTNFEREGIREVFARVQQGINFLLVDDISRLGRSTAETLYFIHHMQASCDVTIMTPHGEINVSQINDLIQATMRSLVSHLSTQYRTRASLRSRKNGFDEKNWSSGNKSIPPGYEPDGNDWVQKDPEEFEAAQAMFNEFLSTESYAATAEHLNDEFGDVLDPIAPWQVKLHLQKRVYIGKPTMAIDSEHLEEDEFSVDEPALQIVSQEVFSQAQKSIEEINIRYSTDDENTVTPQSAADMFGLFAVLTSSPVVTLHCSEPGCDGELRANGQRGLDGDLNAHSYQCKECGKNRKWPYLSELKDMRRKSGETENSVEDSEEDKA